MTNLIDIIFDHSNEVICLIDEFNHIEKFSGSWIKSLGYQKNEIIGSDFISYVHQDDILFLKFAMQATQDFLADEAKKVVGLRTRDKFGKFIWFNWQIHYLPDLRKFLLMGSFIKEPAKSKNSDERATDFLYKIIDSMPFAIFSKDYRSGEGIYVAWNKKAEELWGIERSQILGKTDHELFDPELAEKFKQQDIVSLGTKNPQFSEKENINSPNLGSTWVRTWTIPLENSNHAPHSTVSICQDITDWMKLEEEVNQRRVLAIHSNKMISLGEMASGVAHEINNPLTIIQTKAERLKSLITEDTLNIPKIQDDLNRIQTTVDRIANIIRALRGFSQDVQYDPSHDVSVPNLLKKTLSLFETKLSNLGIKLIYNIHEDYTAYICQSHISESFVNLLLNARDAVVNLDEKWIKLEMEDCGSMVKLLITDSGRGIASEVASRMMEPLFSTKAIGQGTGLGLSVAKGLIKKNHGKIQYVLKDGHTCFEIFLPKSPDSLNQSRLNISPEVK